MSKLTKFLFHPVAYWRDTFRRRNVTPVGSDARLDAALAHFLAGRVEAARSVLGGLPSSDGGALALEARFDLYASRFEEAEQKACRSLLMLSTDSISYRNAFYWRLDALRALSRHAETRAMLDNMPFVDTSNRFFRALRLSVQSVEELGFFQAKVAAYGRGRPGNDKGRYNYSLLLRDLGMHEEAIAVARDRVIELFSSRKFGSAKPQHPANWVRDATVALADLKRDFDAAGIPFFLISGTLLGCVRHSGILGHDKDIDVGVDERYPLERIRQAMLASPRYRVREIPSRRSLYVQHANGVMVDVFSHFMQDGRYYHEGPKVRWWNTPFDLAEVDFLGGRYLIPTNYDTYLTENYGDWRMPNTEFETFVDTPNMEPAVEGHLLWYYVSKLGDYYVAGKLPQLLRVWGAYSRYKPDPTLERLCIKPLTAIG